MKRPSTAPLSLAPLSLASALALAPALMLIAGCSEKSDAPAAKSETVAAVAAPAGKAWRDEVVATPEGGVRMGNPDAPLKLIEYGSLSCPHCAKLAQDGFAKLSEEYVASGRLSYEFRSFVIHPQDVPLTLLARCGSLTAFFPLIDQIYTNYDAVHSTVDDPAVQQKANAALQGPPEQRMIGLADALGFTGFFAERGVSADKARACLADMTRVKEIGDYAQKWSADGIDSTPTLILNGAKLDATTWQALDTALREAGAG
jgi:protein-disulfide isomerase